MVKVIVSKCRRGAVGILVWDMIKDDSYPTLEDAMEKGRSLCEEGKCVIVRPTYNEGDDGGRFFREWRSFNGEVFKECRWTF